MLAKNLPAAFLVPVLGAGVLTAQTPVPSTLPFQGRLDQQVGGAYSGAVAMTFSLYDAATGAVRKQEHPLWPDTLELSLPHDSARPPRLRVSLRDQKAGGELLAESQLTMSTAPAGTVGRLMLLPRSRYFSKDLRCRTPSRPPSSATRTCDSSTSYSLSRNLAAQCRGAPPRAAARDSNSQYKRVARPRAGRVGHVFGRD